jgi:sulfoxide reductase heme-binding subunit YedZ
LQAHHFAEPWLQLVLVWPTMLGDAEKRPFIQVGLLAWVILLALAVTSPQRVLRAMGGKNWQRLHRLIYLAGAAGVVHYWWIVKTGVRSPMRDTVVLAVLLLARVVYWLVKRVKGQARAAAVVAS